MKAPVFSGPSGRKPWKKPEKFRFKEVGDTLRLRGGSITLESFNDDGSANMKCVQNGTGEFVMFVSRRGKNGEWEEEIDFTTLSPGAREFLSTQMKEYDPAIVEQHADAVAAPGGLKYNQLPLDGKLVARDNALKTSTMISPQMPWGEVVKEARDRGYLDDRINYMTHKRHEMEAKIKHKRATFTAEDRAADIAEVARRLTEGARLEKPQGSSFHHLIDFVSGPDSNLAVKEQKFLSETFQSFVIEHDWAAAFAGVEGMDDEGDIQLPFDYTCFELRISGLRVMLLMGSAADDIVGIMCTGLNGRWYINEDRFRFVNGRLEGLVDISILGGGKDVRRFIDLVGRQIRAVCIMLDAGVAEGEVREPSAALNKKRRREGKSELKDYHIVRLAGKHASHHERGDGTGTRRRLHMRRGHWRHFKDGGGQQKYTDAEGTLRSKTWINWMLVGDVSLGFVDKEYRL